MYGCFIAIVIQYYTASAGELCGNCRNGYGVSVLLNKCVTCPSVSGILTAALSECIASTCAITIRQLLDNSGVTCLPVSFCSVVADVVVFVGLLLLIKTFPTWLYPFLFYIQVIQLSVQRA